MWKFLLDYPEVVVLITNHTDSNSKKFIAYDDKKAKATSQEHFYR